MAVCFEKMTPEQEEKLQERMDKLFQVPIANWKQRFLLIGSLLEPMSFECMISHDNYDGIGKRVLRRELDNLVARGYLVEVGDIYEINLEFFDGLPKVEREADRRPNVKPARKETPGVVYVVSTPDNHVKIGKSTSSGIGRRIASLTTMSPLPLHLLVCIESPDCFRTERSLHERFESKRLHGEWFALTPDDIEVLKSLTTNGKSGVVQCR